MPHKDPAIKRAYMRVYHRKHKAKRVAQKGAWRKAQYEKDPEAVRAKWRQYRKTARARAAIRELEALKAAKPSREGIGYTGRLNLSGR